MQWRPSYLAIVGQGPTMIAVGGSVLAYRISFFSPSVSLGDGSIQTKIVFQRAVKPEATEPGKGHFFSNIYQKRNRNKKNWKGNQNNNITFKRLLIFPFQYVAEKKLKQEYWEGNQNKKYLVLST